MTFEEIIQELGWSETVPVEAINAALAAPVSFVDQSVRLLTRVAKAASTEDEEQALPVLVRVLAEIGDERAFLPMMRVLRLPPEQVHDLFDDALTESIGSVVISLAGNQAAVLEEVLNDGDVDEFVRDAACRAWTRLVLTGAVTRDAAKAFLSDYPVRVGLDPSDYGWSSWIDAVTILGFVEMRDFAQQHLRRDDNLASIINGTDGTIQEFEEELSETLADPDRWESDPRYQPLSSAIDELSQWYSYSAEYREELARDFGDDFEEDADFGEPVTNPFRDVGRNDPCPCGSGKKFKKCCLGKEGLPD